MERVENGCKCNEIGNGILLGVGMEKSHESLSYLSLDFPRRVVLIMCRVRVEEMEWESGRKLFHFVYWNWKL